MQTIKHFIKQHWRTLVEILGVVGVIFAFLQLNIQQRQFAYEFSQRPNLEYSIDPEVSSVDLETVNRAADQLLEQYFDLLYQSVQNESDVSYTEASNKILPLSITVPPVPVSSSIRIENSGNATAMRVRVNIKSNRAISSAEVSSSEPWKLIKGEIGQENVVIEIDRIIAGGVVTVVVGSTSLASGSKPDQITLSKSEGSNNVLMISMSGSEAGSYSFFPGPQLPQLIYFPSDQPSFIVVITSDEGGATAIPAGK